MIAENTDLLRGIVMSFLGCCIRWPGAWQALSFFWLFYLWLFLWPDKNPGQINPRRSSAETFEFPPPVQWKMGGSAFGRWRSRSSASPGARLTRHR